MIDQDVISIRHLQLPHGALAPTIWGEAKPQPATISLALTLRDGIDSAADQDALDHNTIHYGQLAKAVRETCAVQGLTLYQIFAKVTHVVFAMSIRTDGTLRLAKTAMELCLPKASMHGDAIALTFYRTLGEAPRMVLAIRSVKVMTLIGVNANERQARQPLFVDLDVEINDQDRGEGPPDVADLFALEDKLYNIIEATTFETLEALAAYAVDKLRDILRLHTCYQAVRLEIRKPRAIAFADAPSIEISRRLKAK